MYPSLRALLCGILDYAGLFPPAGLPLNQAIHNYARYRKEPDGWMLGRFVCPANRLGELAPFHKELFALKPPFVCSALGRGGKNVAEFLINLHTDLEAIAAFHKHHRGRASVDVLECRLPADVLQPHELDSLRALLATLAELIESLAPESLTLYYEIPYGRDWHPAVSAVRHILAKDRKSAMSHTRRRYRSGGEKLRCGGADASAFPSVEQVAFAITACRDAGVPIKFTAGLHQPLRHFDNKLQTPMHGFLNVIGAGVLAQARPLCEKQVQQIIEDEDPASFRFDKQHFHWKDIHATTAEINKARRHAVISFGSCSFDEPRADLKALGFV